MRRVNSRCLCVLCGLLLAGTSWAAAPRDAASPKPAGDTPRVKPEGDAPKARPAAEAKLPDLNANVISPELIVRAGPQIGIDPAVIRAIHQLAQETRAKLQEAQQTLRTDTQALNEMLKQPRPEVAACLDQLDKVLADERAIKRVNLEMALAIRSQLTPEQITRLTQLRDEQAGAEGVTPERLRAKMQRVQALVQQRQQEGRNMAEVPGLVQQARTAAEQGNLKEADATLDKIANLLK